MLIKRIEHEYEDFKLDISDVEIKKNSIIGLVGKNGAGKTTFMEILAGYKKANKYYIVENLNEKDILFIPSDVSVYEYLTVKEFLDFIVKYSDTEIDAEFLLLKLAMDDKRNTLIEDLSQGMKKKLTLVPLFVKKYSTIILDEPFNSIDLEYIYILKKYLSELKMDSSIIISSHILETLADICDSVILIENGHIKKHMKDSINIKNLESEIFE